MPYKLEDIPLLTPGDGSGGCMRSVKARVDGGSDAQCRGTAARRYE